MNSSSYYKKQMEKYSKDIKCYEDILADLEKEKEESEKLKEQIENSGIFEKIDAIFTEMDNINTKLEQASKYMDNIRIVKGKTFDNGELAKAGKSLCEHDSDLNALTAEIEEKLKEIDEDLETTWDNIVYNNEQLKTAKKNYDNAYALYKKALNEEKMAKLEISSGSLNNNTTTATNTTITSTKPVSSGIVKGNIGSSMKVSRHTPMDRTERLQ